MSAPEVITKEQVDAASIKAADAIRRKSPDAQALVFEANRLWTIWHFFSRSRIARVDGAPEQPRDCRSPPWLALARTRSTWRRRKRSGREAARNAAALRSQEWTAEQAARLDTTDRPRNSSFVIQYEIQCPTDPAG
jgi:hypothetical protein